MNAINRVGMMTNLRPRVSAKNPHKCEEKIIPINDTAPRTPFCFVVNFKSQCETGMTKLMAQVSYKTAPSITPLINTRK